MAPLPILTYLSFLSFFLSHISKIYQFCWSFQIMNILCSWFSLLFFILSFIYIYKDILKPLTVWITTNCGKFLKRWQYQTILPVSWGTCMWVKKQQLELDIEQLTGSKFGKEYDKAVYCHPAYLTYMHSISCEMPTKLEPRLLGISHDILCM